MCVSFAVAVASSRHSLTFTAMEFRASLRAAPRASVSDARTKSTASSAVCGRGRRLWQWWSTSGHVSMNARSSCSAMARRSGLRTVSMKLSSPPYGNATTFGRKAGVTPQTSYLSQPRLSSSLRPSNTQATLTQMALMQESHTVAVLCLKGKQHSTFSR